MVAVNVLLDAIEARARQQSRYPLHAHFSGGVVEVGIGFYDYCGRVGEPVWSWFVDGERRGVHPYDVRVRCARAPYSVTAYRHVDGLDGAVVDGLIAEVVAEVDAWLAGQNGKVRL